MPNPHRFVPSIPARAAPAALPAPGGARKIRLCILIGRYLPDFSGHAIQIHRLLPHLRERGIEPTVVAYRPSAETAGKPFVDSGRVLRVLANERAPFAKTRHTFELAAHFQRHARDYDLVHTNLHGWELLLTLPWMQRLGLPVLYEMVSLGADDPYTVSRLRFGRIKLALLSRVDAWVGISEAFRRTLPAADIAAERYRCIYGGVDLERYRPPSDPERRAVRAELGLPEAGRVVVSAGALLPRKGMDRVLRAWARLRPTPGRDVLLLIGPANAAEGLPERYVGHPDELRALAAAAGVAETVRLVGRVNDLERWYAAADLFVFLSHREGQGYVIVEAMASGLPCVVSPLDGIGSELVGDSGFVAQDPDDADAVAARMAELLADPERRRALGVRARARAAERFSMTARAAALADAYRELLEARRESGRRHREAIGALKYPRRLPILTGSTGPGSVGVESREELMPDLRRWLPPILLDLSRRLRPPRPRFSGVFASAAEVPDESPFASDAWLAFSAARLAALCAPQPAGFLPQHPLPMAQYPIALIANLLAEVSVCRVLDFAGGSGAIYFLLHSYLSQPERVEWDVFDDDRLMALGRSQRSEAHRLRFLKALPEPGQRYELLHVNTSLQYIHQPLACLGRLLEHRPRYVVLSRLLAGEVQTWYTAENLRSRRAPCAILDVHELSAWFDARGYRLVFKAPALDEPISDARYATDIPAALRIPHALHLVFAEVRAPDRLSP